MRLFSNPANAYGVVSADIATAAATYAYAGWPVFPCEPKGKRPIVEGGFHAASTDAQTVHQWWKRNPRANIGFATGALVVVEIDGPVGMASMARLRAEHGWPVTMAAMSGRADGGLHTYWRCPEGVEVRNAAGVRNGRGIGDGIDVRGTGGFVVLPPSVHESGRRYVWSARRDPLELPGWMVERLRPIEHAPPEAPVSSAEGYGRAALEGEAHEVLNAGHGQLNAQLNTSAFKLARLVVSGALAEDDVTEGLLAAAVEAGHPPRSAAKTIESGLRGGMRGT